MITIGPIRAGTAACHIAVLCAFSIAQPVFDLLGRNPTFFVAHRAGAMDITLFALAVSLGPPLVLVPIIGAFVVLGRGARGALLVAVALLVGLVALPLLHRVGGMPTAAVLGGAVVIGGLTAVAHARFAALRSVLTVLTPAVAVFPLLFLLHSPVSRLVRAADETVVGATGVQRSPPIVFVVFDGLALTSLLDASGAVDEARYPAFARLAAISTWYRDTTTVAEMTHLAVPAILTGRYPRATRAVPSAVDHPRNLFTLLAGAYDMRVHETVTALCPDWLCGVAVREPALVKLRSMVSDAAVVYAHFLVPAGLRGRLPSIEGRWRDFGIPVERGDEVFSSMALGEVARDRVAAFERFLAGIGGGSRPTVHFVHTLLPHSPFVYLPSGRMYGAPQELPGFGMGRWGQNAAAIEVGEERYLLQLGFVDRLLGRLLDRLDETGLLDAALLAVTADHGCSFLPGEPHRGITQRNYHDVAAVPLFIKEPGQREARVLDQPLETIDVLPTVAATLGIDIPWPVDGHPALARNRGDARVVVRHNGKRWPVPADMAVRDRAVARRIARFGAGTSWDVLFTRGPHAALIGASARTLASARAAPYTTRLWAGALREMRVDGPVPAYVSGTLRPTTGAGPDAPIIAIAVNGTIAATVQTQRRLDGALGFQALVPETVIRPGVNRYDVFVVDDPDPARPRLAPVPATT